MFTPTVEYDYDEFDSGAVIKVIGVGGGGGNAVNHMILNMIKSDSATMDDNLYRSEHGSIVFYAVNSDVQALRKSQVPHTIQIGAKETRGLGCGGDPKKGRKSAEDDEDEIRKMLDGADMVFIAAGMGGGTGTGAAPIIARVAKELGILTIAVVTKPFSFEGKRRMYFAELGVKDLSQYVDSLIVIPNSKLIKVLPKGIKLQDAFSAANDVLRNSVMGISDMITSPGLINLDFADVKTVMSEMGRAMMGSGAAKGECDGGRAETAAKMAVASPLLEDVDLAGAKGVIVNVTAGMDLSLDEFETVGAIISEFASDEATVIVGTALDPEMTDEIRVTIVATGIGDTSEPEESIQIVQQPRTPEPVIPEPPKKDDSGWLFEQSQQEQRQVPNIPTYGQAQPVQQPQQNIQPQRNPLDTPITERLSSLKKENLFNPSNFGSKE